MGVRPYGLNPQTIFAGPSSFLVLFSSSESPQGQVLHFNNNFRLIPAVPCVGSQDLTPKMTPKTDAIPNCHVTFAHNEGHLLLLRNFAGDIISVLVSG